MKDQLKTPLMELQQRRTTRVLDLGASPLPRFFCVPFYEYLTLQRCGYREVCGEARDPDTPLLQGVCP